MTLTLILGIFLGALASGWHCALMCAGFAAAIENPAPLLPRAQLLRVQAVMHLGRITSYTLLGALAGFMGQFAWRLSALPLQRVLLMIAAVVVLLQARRLWRIDAPGGTSSGLRLKNALAGLWAASAARLHKRWSALPRHRASTRFVLGLLWGLVPCGLVYAVLPVALLAGDAAHGAAVMLAFGLGTLPNLMLLSGLSAQLAQWGHQPWMRRLAALLLAAAGSYALYRAVSLSDEMWRGGLCLN